MRAQGEQATWAKLSAIQANCGIETTLDACMVAASKMAAERRAANARARGSRGRLNAPAKRAPPRCPSWVNMSAIGAFLGCSTTWVCDTLQSPVGQVEVQVQWPC